VQHHHAHIAGCMAEHGIEGPVIGLALDGTGYGTDGRIWGGEVLIVRGPDPGSFDRFAHLDYVPMPGGEAAIREPWRMALGHLHAAGFDIESPELLKRSWRKPQDARVLARMIERGVEYTAHFQPRRLFDAVAAVCWAVAWSITKRRRRLSWKASPSTSRMSSIPATPFELHGGDWTAREPARISAAPLWRELLEDLRSGVAKSHCRALSRRRCSAFVSAAVLAKDATGIRQVALSGGCMHNRRLARLLRAGLEAKGFEGFSAQRCG
jgi:hydrogenase maturation protein HypF